MACAIHHGGGVGTYKTFSVIQRHAIPQLLSGRIVVSTIRGFDSIRVIEAVLNIDIPEQSKIIFVDLETTEGREKIQRWWEWVPKGAYIIIDEAQLIYPKSKSRNILSWEYPPRDGLTSSQTAELDDRPNTFVQAFTMQRHFNWDLAVITPNIKMLLPEIREVTQVAYEHKYMGGLVPWAKHGWREIQHDPLTTGRSSPHPPVRYKADKRIYQVYKSTKTGSHSTANAERSIFQNPKVISVFLLAFFALLVSFYMVFKRFSHKKDISVAQEDSIPIIEVYDNAVTDNVVNGDTGALASPTRTSLKIVETTKFQSDTMAIVGKFFDEYIIEVGKPPNSTQFTTSFLYNNGVKLKIKNDCLIELEFDNTQYNVRCPLHARRFDSPSKESFTTQKQIKVVPLGAVTGA